MNFQQMMKQAQTLQKKMSNLQQELENLEIVGKAGGNLVVITANAKGTFKKVTIDRSLLIPEEKEMLEDLILAALADTKRKADEATNEMMNGMGVPPDMMNIMS